MSNVSIRIGAIGCGRIAQHYSKILASGAVSGWEMVGVCDPIQERAADLAGHFKTRSFTDHEEMLRQCRPELVLVLSPSGLHYTHTRIALTHGMHVLTEKPVAMLPSEASELHRLAREMKLMCAVAFQNRFNPAIQCVRRALETGRFGNVVTGTVRLRWCRKQSYYEDGWHGTWAQDGGVINQQALHHVDILNWLLGPVDSVCAATGNRVNRLEAEDTLIAAVRFKSGALGTIEATTGASEDLEASLSVVGSKGLAVIGGIALNKVETWRFAEPQPEDVDVPVKFSQDVPNGFGWSHGPLLQQVLDTIAQGSVDPPVSAEDAMRTTELVHALYRSEEERGWVSLATKPISERLGRIQHKQ
jgi:predicted dehydrogenase